MRRAQAAVLLVALALPLGALALAALALLGAQVQGLRAQRVAEAAALRAALGRATADPPGAAVGLTWTGSNVTAAARLPATALRLPLLGRVAYVPHGAATARRTVTDDGAPGAVLVG